jgi:hypothetical protein
MTHHFKKLDIWFLSLVVLVPLLQAKKCIDYNEDFTKLEEAKAGSATSGSTDEIELCEENFYVNAGVCTPCALGTRHDAGGNPEGENTECAAIECEKDFYVKNRECIACAAGTTNPKGNLATDGDSSCTPITCGQNEHVQSNVCTACPNGEENRAGDDASGEDTDCDGNVCAENQHISNGLCTPCAEGTRRQAGDDPGSPDTQCDPFTCEVNFKILGYACEECGAAETSDGSSTTCDPLDCDPNKKGEAHECVNCEPGSTSVGGSAISCEATVCLTDHYVSSNQCVACASENYNSAGNLATGADTQCSTFLEAVACGRANDKAASGEAQINIIDGDWVENICGCEEDPSLNGEAGSICTLPSARPVIFYLATDSSGDGHNVVSTGNALGLGDDPKDVNQAYEMTQNLPVGEYSFSCEIHGQMYGTLIVKPYN